MKIEELRNRYKKFVYKKFKWSITNNDLVVEYDFLIEPDLSFSPKMTFKNLPKDFQANPEILDNLVFQIGLIEIPSYWKSTCAQEISVEVGHLDENQTVWWHDLFMNGMGQYFYENNIDYTNKDFLIITSSSKSLKFDKASIDTQNYLIPVSGGKDSALTLEILQKHNLGTAAFLLNPTKSAYDTVQIADIQDKFIVERELDNKLLKLNESGFLNGHTPFSAMLAFTSVLAGYLYGYKNVVFSNEASSNENYTEYLGKGVNHQYSKTLDFENKFRAYNQKYLSNINYFSFLRPIYELQIAKVFSKYDKYFNIIRSCNVGRKENIWCCECAKCLSTYILLYPFLKTKIDEVFPRNLFENESSIPLLEHLIKDNYVKPFECVGTREELKIALYLILKDRGKEDYPILLKKAEELIANEANLESRATELLHSWSDENNLPQDLEKLLKEELWKN